MREPLDPIAAADAFWLHADAPENRTVINGILALDGALELPTLMQTVSEGLLRFDRFRRPVVERDGHPFWGDEASFRAEAHFEVLELPEGAGEAELQALASRVVSSPLPKDLPLWRIYLVRGHPRGSVVIVRIHHCIADGIALVAVLLSMAKGLEPHPAGRPDVPPDPGPLGRVREALGHASELIHQGWRFAEHLAPQALLRHGQHLSSAVAKLTTMSTQTHPVFKGRLGPDKAVAWSEPMPLDRIKGLGRKLDGKVNDVLLAMAAGALRRYLVARGQPADGEVFRCTVPINLRPLSEAHRLGNRFGLVFMHLPIHLDSAGARFAAVRAEMNEIKGGAEAIASFSLLRTLGAAPGRLEAQAVDLFSSKASMVLTNVPGPRAPLSFAGRPLRRIMFWVPQTGSVSMGLSIISYVDHVMVGVQADRGLIPEPAAIADAMNAEIAHMLDVL